MPKGKRKTRDYDREIEEAAKRMHKYPEYLHAASDSEEWRNFLLDIGVNPEIVKSSSGRDFWEKVRDKVTITETGYTVRGLAEQNVRMITGVFRDARGRYTAQVTDQPIISYYHEPTKRFISPVFLEKY